MIRSLFPILALGAGVYPLVAAAQADQINQRELGCLTTALYAYAQQSETPMTAEVLAEELRAQVAASEAAGDYCKYAGDETRPPWETSDLAAITKAMREAERGSDEQRAAQAQLQAYQATLNGYQTAQVIAYKMMNGWSFGMPMTRKDMEAAEAAAEAEAATRAGAAEAIESVDGAGSAAGEADVDGSTSGQSVDGATEAEEPAGT